MDTKIGITERADPTVNLRWVNWVESRKPAVLITKMPRLLYPMLTGEENIIVHCTITGLGGGRVEPNVDSYKTSLEWYHKFCTLFGKDRVVLRVDPIINEEGCTETINGIISESEGRVRISFMDLYPHSIKRFIKARLPISQKYFHQSLEDRKYIWESLGKPEVCSEPGLPNVPCVGELDCRILGVEPSSNRKGQRRECGCLSNKIELCSWPPKCTYRCLYCYWKD